MKNLSKESSVLIATFSPHQKGKRLPTNGMIEPLLSFLGQKVNKIVLLDQPYPGSDALIPFVEIYNNGKLVNSRRSSVFLYFLYPFLKVVNYDATHIAFKLRDFFSVLDCGLTAKTRLDIFIGLEAINTLAGIALKKLGRVETVIYYVSDYSPTRYTLNWFNKIYVLLDRFVATHCDFIWDVSKAMMSGRIKAGLDPKKAARVIHVPNALFPKQIHYLTNSKIIPDSLVFVGSLGRENGPDLAIKTVQQVIKTIPQVKLHIYGDGESDIARIKKLTAKLQLTDKVIFHGFVTDQVELSNKISQYAVGLAPYLALSDSPRWWADATKIRLYLGCGIPVVTTQVPPLGKEIDGKAGLVAKDTPKDQARAIIHVLTDKSLREKFKTNARKMAKNNTWENTYAQAIKQMVS